MSYQFRIKLTEEDFVEFNKYACWRAPWQKKARINYAIRSFILVAVVYLCTILLIEKFDEPVKNSSILIYVSCVMLIILFIFTYSDAPQQVAKRARKFIRKEENRHILEEKVVDINEEGIHSDDQRNRVLTRWPGIIRYAETRDYFFLLINDQQGHIIPKKQLRDNKEIEEFTEFLARHIPLSVSFRSLQK